MSSTTLYRLSGITLIVGSIVAAIGLIISSFASQGNDPNQYKTSLFTITFLMTIIGLMLVTAGLPGIYVRQARQTGWLGLIGFMLILFGGLLFMSLFMMSFIFLPYLAEVAPKLVADQNSGPAAIGLFFIVASLMYTLGTISFGIATMRAHVFPRWTGLMLIIGGILILADVVPLPPIISTIIADCSNGLTFLGFAWLGYSIMAQREVAETQSSMVPPVVPEAQA